MSDLGEGEVQSVPFRSALKAGGDAIALIDTDEAILCSYAQLQRSVQALADSWSRRPRRLILLFANNDISSVVIYLAALEAGHAIFISPISISHPSAAALILNYRPEIVLWKGGSLSASVAGGYGAPEEVMAYRMARRLTIQDPPPHESLGIVLSTSGSSGSSKAVRLPATGLWDSAARVAETLRMKAPIRVLANLPFGYVYGLSVLNSTISCGGSIVLVSGSAADRGFWGRTGDAGVTMIPAVSQTLEFMKLHGVDADSILTLRKVTHSGSSLDPELFSWVYERLSRRGIDVYLMYGQTEAGGRISVLQPTHLPWKHRSVGTALRGCEVRIGTDGEILFRGPGVMLGYAHGRVDLSKTGRSEPFLRTGDLGYLDDCGFLHIGGRVSRDRKIFGRRINLDEVEAFARRGAQAVAVESNGVIWIVYEAAVPDDVPSAPQLSAYFQLPPQAFRVFAVERIPRSARGKVAYDALMSMVEVREARSGTDSRARPPP